MSLSEQLLWHSNSVLSAMNLKQVEHMSVRIHVYEHTPMHTFKLKFHLSIL